MTNNSPFFNHIPRIVNLWITVAFSCASTRDIWVQGIQALAAHVVVLFSYFFNKSRHFSEGCHSCSSQCYPPKASPNLHQCLIMMILSSPVYLCSITWFALSLVCTMVRCAHTETGNHDTASIQRCQDKFPLKDVSSKIVFTACYSNDTYPWLFGFFSRICTMYRQFT